MKFSEKVGNGLANKRLNFGGDPGHCQDMAIVYRMDSSLLGDMEDG